MYDTGEWDEFICLWVGQRDGKWWRSWFRKKQGNSYLAG